MGNVNRSCFYQLRTGMNKLSLLVTILVLLGQVSSASVEHQLSSSNTRCLNPYSKPIPDENDAFYDAATKTHKWAYTHDECLWKCAQAYPSYGKKAQGCQYNDFIKRCYLFINVEYVATTGAGISGHSAYTCWSLKVLQEKKSFKETTI